jgi:hypothetical protein
MSVWQMISSRTEWDGDMTSPRIEWDGGMVGITGTLSDGDSIEEFSDFEIEIIERV